MSMKSCRSVGWSLASLPLGGADIGMLLKSIWIDMLKFSHCLMVRGAFRLTKGHFDMDCIYCQQSRRVTGQQTPRRQSSQRNEAAHVAWGCGELT
jgi:hypothetical protein